MDRTVRVRLEAITAQYEQRMRSAGLATDQVQGSVGALQGPGGIEGLKAKFRSAGPAIAVATAAAYAAKKAFDELYNAGSQLVAVQGAVGAVFEDSAGQIVQYAENAERLGLAETEASRMAAMLGGQLKVAGLSASEAADQTQVLIDRAADMSVGFGTTAEALNGISALLRGEYDTIERFAVGIKQSDVNARLAAEGLGDLEGEALKAAQAQAVLGLLMEQTADRAGQWNSETNKAAREQQELTAKVENLKAEIGRGLLPIMSGFVDGLNTGIDTARNLADGVVLLTEDLRGLAGALSVGGVSIGGLGNLGDGIGKLLDHAGGLGGIFRDAGRAVQHYADEAERARRINEFADNAVRELAGSFDILGSAATAAGGAVGAATKHIIGELEDASRDYESLFSPLFAYEDALAGVNDAQEAAATSQRGVADAQREAARAAEDVAAAQLEVADALAMTFDAAAAARQGIRDLADEQRAATDPVFALMRALERQAETARGPRVIRGDDGSSRLDVGANPLEAAEAAAGVDQAAIQLLGAVRAGDVAPEKLRATFQQWLQQGRITEAMAVRLGAKLGEIVDVAEDLQGANVDQAIASETAAEKAEFQAEKADAVRTAQDRLEDAHHRFISAQERVASATDAVVRSQDDAVGKADALDRAMFELNQQVEDNPGLISEAKAKLDEWVSRGLIPAHEAASRLHQMIGNVNDAMAAFGADGDATAEMRVTADISDLIRVTQDPGLRAALQRMWSVSLHTALMDLDPSGESWGDIGAIGGSNLDLTGSRAGGGDVWPGRWLVGEDGPEVLDLDGYGHVYSSADTEAMISGLRRGGAGGGSSTVIYNYDQRTYDADTTVYADRGVVRSERELVSEMEARRGGVMA